MGDALSLPACGHTFHRFAVFVVEIPHVPDTECFLERSINVLGVSFARMFTWRLLPLATRRRLTQSKQMRRTQSRSRCLPLALLAGVVKRSRRVKRLPVQYGCLFTHGMKLRGQKTLLGIEGVTWRPTRVPVRTFALRLLSLCTASYWSGLPPGTGVFIDCSPVQLLYALYLCCGVHRRRRLPPAPHVCTLPENGFARDKHPQSPPVCTRCGSQ